MFDFCGLGHNMKSINAVCNVSPQFVFKFRKSECFYLIYVLFQ